MSTPVSASAGAGVFLRLYTNRAKHPAKSPYVTVTGAQQASHILSYPAEKAGIELLRAVLSCCPDTQLLLYGNTQFEQKYRKFYTKTLDIGR